jgi:tetratricopeptide (TPR) repeat protein
MEPKREHLNDDFQFFFEGGSFTAAAELAEKAVNAALNQFGQDHPNFGTALNKLAIASKALEEYEKAERLYLRSLEIRKRVYGTEHHLIAQSLNNLGSAWRSVDALHRYGKRR